MFTTCLKNTRVGMKYSSVPKDYALLE